MNIHYMSSHRRKSRGDSIDSRSRNSSIDSRSRNSSMDSRSYSFDAPDTATAVNNTKNSTKVIQIKRRKREQTIDPIIPSPVPDKFKYFTLISMNNYCGPTQQKGSH